MVFKSSLRANGSRECAPDDRLREAIHNPSFRHCERSEAIHSQGNGDNGLRRFARNESLRSGTARMTLSTRATPTAVIAREGGRSSIPEPPVMESRSRGVPCTPLEPVIGPAEGEIRW